MRVKGLEPPRRKALDPKSSASANSATPAKLCFYYNIFQILFQDFFANYFLKILINLVIFLNLNL